MTISHYVICRPDKLDARDRLAAADIKASVYPAIVPSELISAESLIAFNGTPRERTVSNTGNIFAVAGVLGAGLASGAEWIGLWEDDVELAGAVGWQDVTLPSDCAVLYLGGALWGLPEQYGKLFAGKVWQVTAPLMISCTHALLIHRTAAQDILPVLASMKMTVDDLLSSACLEAQRTGKWSTCFMNPWVAWQVDRPETWPK
jgi:hypothetical protein